MLCLSRDRDNGIAMKRLRPGGRKGPLAALPLLPAAVMAATLVVLPVRADSVLAVDLITAAPSALVLDSTLTGTIESASAASLSFRSGGKVVAVRVGEGDRVTRGAELAHLDPLQQNQQLAVARAGLSSAEAALAQAEQAFTRQSAMLERGIGTRAARDGAQEALSQARAARDQASSRVDQAGRAADDTVLRAPFDGIVTARQVEPGQIVGAAQTVLELAALDDLEVVLQVPDAAELNQAMAADVTLRVIDGAQDLMHGKVTEIAPLVNAQTGSVTVRARITDAPQDPALLGAAARATIHMPAGQAIALPWEALTSSAAGPAVWKVGNDFKVHLQPIEVSRYTTTMVVVAKGVSPGDTVVGKGSQMLYPGREVRQADGPQTAGDGS